MNQFNAHMNNAIELALCRHCRIASGKVKFNSLVKSSIITVLQMHRQAT